VRLGEATRDGDHLLRAFARAEDGLGHAMTERAMQIHAREAQILDGKIAEPAERRLGRHRPARHRFQQRSYFFPVHFSISLALPLRKPWRSTVT
jgi:hypothetical protein